MVLAVCEAAWSIWSVAWDHNSFWQSSYSSKVWGEEENQIENALLFVRSSKTPRTHSRTNKYGLSDRTCKQERNHLDMIIQLGYRSRPRDPGNTRNYTILRLGKENLFSTASPVQFTYQPTHRSEQRKQHQSCSSVRHLLTSQLELCQGYTFMQRSPERWLLQCYLFNVFWSIFCVCCLM